VEAQQAIQKTPFLQTGIYGKHLKLLLSYPNVGSDQHQQFVKSVTETQELRIPFFQFKGKLNYAAKNGFIGK
jgi:hypothetical protein